MGEIGNPIKDLQLVAHSIFAQVTMPYKRAGVADLIETGPQHKIILGQKVVVPLE